MNATLHEVDSIARRTVEGTAALREALDELIGDSDFDLINTYVVTLYEETLSDGSKVHSVGIRIAERI